MIKVSNLTYIYDQRKTDGINEVSFDVPKNSVVSLVGPSGSGKTTTLKCMAGMISDFSGRIEVSNDEKISYVDQIPSLNLETSVFENLNIVLDNIDDLQKRENQIRMTLSQLDLTNEINTLVGDLSGGQRQRVTLAKSLITNPTILMLDEPFANLDKSLRLQLFNELFPILKDQGITLIWVTHNQEEALRFSDQMVLLNYGRIEQIGSPQELYFRPKNLFTAKFFGETNVAIGKVLKSEKTTFDFQFLGNTYTSPTLINIEDITDLLITVKPEFVVLQNDENSTSEVEHDFLLGSQKLLKVRTDGGLLWAKLPGNSPIQTGDFVSFHIEPQNFQFLKEV